MTCAECGSDRKRSSPCAACRKRKAWVASVGPNRAALEEQIQAMATSQEHRALVAACRSLADRVDDIERIGGFDDKAWREYRLALKELREATSDRAPTSFESLQEHLRAQVPDP